MGLRIKQIRIKRAVDFDEMLIARIDIIAGREFRSRNKMIEFALNKWVVDWEQKNEQITEKEISTYFAKKKEK